MNWIWPRLRTDQGFPGLLEVAVLKSLGRLFLGSVTLLAPPGAAAERRSLHEQEK